MLNPFRYRYLFWVFQNFVNENIFVTFHIKFRLSWEEYVFTSNISAVSD